MAICWEIRLSAYRTIWSAFLATGDSSRHVDTAGVLAAVCECEQL